jgi:septal ring factor EnvC (AmiA/AmiB activator)
MGKRVGPKGSALFLNNRSIHKESKKLAKTNFQYEKRQKDLEKKRKKEEKLKKKLDRSAHPATDPDQAVADGDASDANKPSPLVGETEAK